MVAPWVGWKESEKAVQLAACGVEHLVESLDVMTA